MILDGTKIPFTKKVMAEEEKLLSVIDKTRLVIQGGSDYARKAIGRDEAVEAEEPPRSTGAAKTTEALEQAYQMAKEIREGADKYADEVLANLEATSTRLLRTIKAGRERLAKTTAVGSQNEA